MLLRALPLCLLALLPGVVRSAETSPLTLSASAFVKAQATSKVQWQPWTEAVLAQAKQQKKSVYVFIGSPLSELTRATINQTFTSEKTVSWLNENFVCLFVDADAQPDVAAYGQYFIRTVKQLQGSPVHLWLVPDTLQPYDGANYLPPSEEWGKPGFLKAARAALDTWTVDPARARALASEAADMMRPVPLDLSAKPDIEAKLAAAAKAWTAAIDPVNGGFGSAPKLPEPELIRFLLTRDAPAREAALNAARALVNGALRDPVDGGFYRRCIDDQWKEPYHQKLLIDQARIALALFDAADAAKDEKLRATGIGAVNFALKHLRKSDRFYVAALDGTGEEGHGPGVRPKFVPVGSASWQATGLLIVAMVRGGWIPGDVEHLVDFPYDRAAEAHREFKPVHSRESQAPPTAGDLLSMIIAAKAIDDREDGRNHFLALANSLYFDPASGSYQAVPGELPPGIATRVPISGESPSAEVLALLAGVDSKTADLIRRNLMHQIEYDELPPGDILLGLSQGQK